MAKNRFSKNYKKAYEINKKANDEIINNQCECPHQDDDGDMSIDIVHKGDRRAYRCNNCQKIISIDSPTKEELMDAADTVDTAIDIIKMQLNTKSEKQQRILTMCADTQKWLRKIEPIYSQYLAEAVNKNKHKNKGSRGGATLHID